MSATDATLKRRRGGRKARKATRTAPLANYVRPVWPGMASDRYQPLTPGDMANIHTAILDILETVGMADAIPTCIDAITGVGGFINDKGRLCFPKALIEDTIASASRTFVLCGQTPDRDLEPWGNKVYFGTGCAAVHIVDPTSGAYRDSTLSDLYERRILPMAKKAFDGGGGDSRGNRFQWPLLVAYLLWVLEMCLTDRRRP